MKPIIRWTMHDVLNVRGFNILKTSINQMLALYKNRFDYYVQYNRSTGLYEKLIKNFIECLNINLIIQDSKTCPISVEKLNTFWKICPPRLNINCHEIILDNDVVFFQAPWEIEKFLDTNLTLVVADSLKYMGRIGHNYDYALNSGVMGLPPGFDFENEIKKNYNLFNLNKHLNEGDEQGLLTYTLMQQPNILVSCTRFISLHSRRISSRVFNENDSLTSPDWLEYEDILSEKLRKSPVVHFLGANRGVEHYAWSLFKPKIIHVN